MAALSLQRLRDSLDGQIELDSNKITSKIFGAKDKYFYTGTFLILAFLGYGISLVGPVFDLNRLAELLVRFTFALPIVSLVVRDIAAFFRRKKFNRIRFSVADLLELDLKHPENRVFLVSDFSADEKTLSENIANYLGNIEVLLERFDGPKLVILLDDDQTLLDPLKNQVGFNIFEGQFKLGVDSAAELTQWQKIQNSKMKENYSGEVFFACLPTSVLSLSRTDQHHFLKAWIDNGTILPTAADQFEPEADQLKPDGETTASIISPFTRFHTSITAWMDTTGYIPDAAGLHPAERQLLLEHYDQFNSVDTSTEEGWADKVRSAVEAHERKTNGPRVAHTKPHFLGQPPGSIGDWGPGINRLGKNFADDYENDRAAQHRRLN